MQNLAKKIASCKHPNSRKTIAITKELKKKAKRDNMKMGHAIKQNIIGEKLIWFKERLISDIPEYNPDQTEDILMKYLSRFDEELEQIKLKHSIGMRKNRQHASREDVINLTIKREKEEFETCGLEVPDLMNPQQLTILRQWNGELRYLEHFKLKRIGKKHLQQEREHIKKVNERQQISASKQKLNTDNYKQAQKKTINKEEFKQNNMDIDL